MEATYRLQTNDENWHEIWKEDGEGRELPYCEIVSTDKETVAEVFRAVSTFDQAREALKAAHQRLMFHERCDQPVMQQIESVLAAMEATHE